MVWDTIALIMTSLLYAYVADLERVRIASKGNGFTKYLSQLNAIREMKIKKEVKQITYVDSNMYQ